MLFRLNGYSLLTSPKISTVNGLELSFVSVSANSVLKEFSPIMKSECSRLREIVFRKISLYGLLQEVFMSSDVDRAKIFQKVLNFLMVNL